MMHHAVKVELFAGVEVAVVRRAGGGYEGTEGVVDVVVCDLAAFVGQETNVAVAVVGVEGGVPAVGRWVYLVLTNQIVAVGVGVVNYSVDDLFDYLGVTSRVAIIDEVAGGLAVYGLLDAVAVAIVDHVYN